jgi:diguanylate cyclase (GGDEF)-like protein
MSADSTTFPNAAAEQPSQQIQRDLRRLGWHDWSLWALAFIVIMAMTATLVAVMASRSDTGDSLFQLTMSQSVRGLIGLVLLFTVYSLYQQLQLRKTRVRLATQIDVASQQHERADRLLALATPDELTGLHNERFGLLRLASEISRVQRNRRPLTILMLALDDFAQMNDRYGPAAPDLALKTFAEYLNRAIRGCDLAALAGNGDIMLVLQDCTREQAPTVVKRLASMSMELGGRNIPLTVTAGSASYKTDDTPEQLAQRAHQALDSTRPVRDNQPHPVA